jgi:fatty acid desaturase
MRPSREERREQLAIEREVWRPPLLVAAVVSTLLAVAAALQQWWAPAITLTVIGLANAGLHLYFRKPTRWER